MSNKGKKYEKPLHLDMDFSEALGRFEQTAPKELPDKIKLSQKKCKKPPDKDKSGDLDDSEG